MNGQRRGDESLEALAESGVLARSRQVCRLHLQPCDHRGRGCPDCEATQGMSRKARREAAKQERVATTARSQSFRDRWWNTGADWSGDDYGDDRDE